MTTIGTSQEGADEDTIRQIALMCKMAGTDIHHIGDSGYMGMALPENITAYSVAIRGKRHTYRRMAMSFFANVNYFSSIKSSYKKMTPHFRGVIFNGFIF